MKIDKYVLKNIENKDNSKVDEFHKDYIGRECVIAQLTEGEVAWLFVHFPEEKDTNNEWHRFHTSVVEDINENDMLILTCPAIPVKDIKFTTANSIYTLSKE